MRFLGNEQIGLNQSNEWKIETFFFLFLVWRAATKKNERINIQINATAVNPWMRLLFTCAIDALPFWCCAKTHAIGNRIEHNAIINATSAQSPSIDVNISLRSLRNDCFAFFFVSWCKSKMTVAFFLAWKCSNLIVTIWLNTWQYGFGIWVFECNGKRAKFTSAFPKKKKKTQRTPIATHILIDTLFACFIFMTCMQMVFSPYFFLFSSLFGFGINIQVTCKCVMRQLPVYIGILMFVSFLRIFSTKNRI